MKSRKRLLSRALLCIIGLVLLVAGQAAQAGPAPEVSNAECRVSADQGGRQFPVDRLDPASRCLIGEVINGYTTVGVMGPIRIPIALDLYVYLIDRPVLLASLLRQLDMAKYELSPKGPNQYWVDDGDGTQGLLTLLYHDQTSRIYHVEGYYQGRLFPMVRGRATLFLKLAPVGGPDTSAVSASLVVYTRLNNPVLARLVRILRGLVGDAVTRKLVRGFELTNQLGKRIAASPGLILQQVNALPSFDPTDGQTLKWLLQPQRAAPVAP